MPEGREEPEGREREKSMYPKRSRFLWDRIVTTPPPSARAEHVKVGEVKSGWRWHRRNVSQPRTLERFVPYRVTSAGDERVLRTIIGVQRAINDAEPTASAVMQIVADGRSRRPTRWGPWWNSPRGEEMVYTVTSGSLIGTEGLRLALHGSMSGLSVTTGEVLVANDTETDTRVDRQACRRCVPRSMICVPPAPCGPDGGVLKVMSDRPQAFGGRRPSPEELADFIAAALRRATIMDDREQAASVDGLTGLANRQAFLAGLDRAITTAVTDKHVVAVLYFDLDGFKPINDTYGHAVGDEVLRTVGHRVGANCRAPDLAARIGGDEFAALLITSEKHNVVDRREHLMALVREPIPTSTGLMQVDVSSGFAIVSGTDLAESVLVRADAAMYADKRSKHGDTGSSRA